MASQDPLIVIVGETASGKSPLAIELAKEFNGEVICADSRTVYRGMDIGTAKPAPTERNLVPHHLLDVVTPNERFTAADFKNQAESLITDISARGRLPIVVGGTGLYIDSLLFDYDFKPAGEPDPLNPRHRLKPGSLEPKSIRPYTLIVGLRLSPDVLKNRISERVNSMFEAGLPNEVKQLVKDYGWEVPAMTGVGYRELREYLEGATDLEAVKAKIIKNTQDFAKRQRTWFKRNKSIQWVNDPSKVVEIVTTFLNK